MPITFQPLLNPTLDERPLTVCLRYEHGKKVCQEDIIQIRAIVLTVLDKGFVYVTNEGRGPILPGQYLIYNQWLTEKLRRDPNNPAEQVFLIYDGVDDALAGFHRVRGKYRYMKVPNLEAFGQTTEKLIWYAYDMKRFPELVSAHEELVDHWVMNYPTTEDADLLAALDEMIDASDPDDILGRRNPRRIPLMCFMIQRLLAKSQCNIRDVAMPRVERTLLVLADRHDQIVEQSKLIRRVAGNALRSARTTGDAYDPARLPIEASYLRQLAEEILFKVPDRPISRSWTNTAHNLLYAAIALEQQDMDEAVHHLEIVERMMTLQAEIAPRLLTLRLDLGRVVHFKLPMTNEVLREAIRLEGRNIRVALQGGDYDVGLRGKLVAAPAVEHLYVFHDRIIENDLTGALAAIKQAKSVM